MRSSASSNLIINSPILARASVSSRSSGSPRIRRPRVPCSRNTRLQLSSSWAGTWLSRETPSSASPRSRRSTNSVFRAALQRSGSSAPSTAGGSLLAVAFPFFAPMVDLLGSCHRSRDSVQRDRVRFTKGLGLAAYLAPRMSGAQSTGKNFTIGLLLPSLAREDRVIEGLRAFGYIEGRNIAIERRYTEGSSVQLVELAAELVRLAPDVIFAE